MCYMLYTNRACSPADREDDILLAVQGQQRSHALEPPREGGGRDRVAQHDRHRRLMQQLREAVRVVVAGVELPHVAHAGRWTPAAGARHLKG